MWPESLRVYCRGYDPSVERGPGHDVVVSEPVQLAGTVESSVVTERGCWYDDRGPGAEQVELAIGTNKVLWVLEPEAFNLMLVCRGVWSRILSRQFLLFCIYRPSILMAQMQGICARTRAVLALHSVLTLGIHRDCWTFAETAGDLVADAGTSCALVE